MSMREVNKESQILDIIRRPRRNRKSAAIRALTQETWLHPADFVSPIFVIEGVNHREDIKSMPGISRLSLDLLVKEATELYELGVQGINLFIYTSSEKKDRYGTEALRSGNLLQRAIKAVKLNIPEMCVMVDIALDPFTDHGHDGIIDNDGNILNDLTIKALAKMSLIAAEAGADVVAPSDMMDGRIGYIRRALDQEGFTQVSILSYAAKYASALYGPFREALNSTPKFGDKKSYQMNPANVREALLECSLDEWEGADMLLIKPALPYLDVIAKIRNQTDLPIAAYHVSGEYAMVMAAAQNGWLDGNRVLLESLLCIKRAGASFILTYAAKSMAKLLK
jgi:porphobilinogen synthase